MSFTDEDLKRLKEWGAKCDCNPSTDITFAQFGHLQMKALLSRLEAAELCVEHGNLLAAYLSKKNPDAFEQGAIGVQQRRDEAWRKSAGKS